MPGWLANIEQWIEDLSQILPLPWFTFFGSIIEEIIGIIPSPLVLGLAGSIAQTDGRGLLYLLFIDLVGAAGKTIGAWLLYVLGDKAEDVVVGRFGALVGVSHSSVEKIGNKFGKGRQDDWLVFLSRAIPIMPSAAVSVVAGAIRLPLKTYLIASFLGNCVRNGFYLYIGYVGLAQANIFTEGIESTKGLLQVIGLVVIIGGMAWLYWRNFKKEEKLEKNNNQ